LAKGFSEIGSCARRNFARVSRVPPVPGLQDLESTPRKFIIATRPINIHTGKGSSLIQEDDFWGDFLVFKIGGFSSFEIGRWLPQLVNAEAGEKTLISGKSRRVKY